MECRRDWHVSWDLRTGVWGTLARLLGAREGCAGRRAQDGSAATPRPENPRVCAIVVQGRTSIPNIVQTVDAVKAEGKRWKNKVSPFRVTRSMGSTFSAILATAFKVQGTSF